MLRRMGDASLTTELGRVLVTGGAGFVGANLVTTLLDRGHWVRSFDRAPSLLPAHPQLEVLQGDITDADVCAAAVDGIDTIFHTAAIIELMGGASVTDEYRQRSFAVNVGGGVVNEEVAPWLDLVRKLGVLAGVLSDELPVSLSVQVRGELAAEEVEVLRLSALRGLFSAVIEDAVTFVNAPALAAERGVTAEICKASESPNHRSVVDVRAVGADGSVVTVSGTLYGPQLSQKIVQINGRHFDLRAQGINLIIHYVDRPGALGKIGTLLGTAGVNIQAAQLSEDAEGPGATILLRLDQDVPDDVRTAIAAAVDAYKLEVVDLS